MPTITDAPAARPLTAGEARQRFSDELQAALGDGWTVQRFRRALDSGDLNLDDERVLRLHLLLPLAG